MVIQIKNAKKEIFSMAFLFSLYFIALFFNEKIAIANVLMCIFTIYAKKIFS
ncbi:hypothetical protein H0I83_30820 (plasmid) [Bacillus thuringiensis serovar fukuokaensis]|uniref:hypothetical protein n=1 Tax=Bacillus cereus group TaxID=86661 RepID=UPI000279F2CC|nr:MULTISPECIES: hypothetical protein [Bacillus cereus group]EJR27989.1 hypothetical protein IIE_05402 [Bacillus cereus VD045]HDR4349440.1 hypothetical protein [Bacillus cereus]HDR6958193.1 hypothetical protein [Bacillus cereus]